MSKANRVFSAEFRAQVARRILHGESVAKLHREFEIKKSVLYRWCDRSRKEGAAGLDRKAGRPPGVPLRRRRSRASGKNHCASR